MDFVQSVWGHDGKAQLNASNLGNTYLLILFFFFVYRSHRTRPAETIHTYVWAAPFLFARRPATYVRITGRDNSRWFLRHVTAMVCSKSLDVLIGRLMPERLDLSFASVGRQCKRQRLLRLSV